MKKYMFLILLLALAALCLFGCGRSDKKAASDEEAANNTAVTENSLVDDAVVDAPEKSLQYCDGAVTTRLHFDESGWHWEDAHGFALNGEKVEELIMALRALNDLQPLQTAADPDLYGLAEPRRYLTMTVEDAVLHLNIGDQAEDGSWYMTVDNYEGIYACPDSFVQMLSTNIYDMATLPTLPLFTPENTTQIVADNGVRQIFLRKVDGQWKGSDARVTDRADKVLAALEMLKVSRCFDYQPSQQALHLCGFSTPTAIITVEYLNSVDVESSFTFTLGALRSAEEGYYATLNNDDTIYLLPVAQVSPLLVLLVSAN